MSSNGNYTYALTCLLLCVILSATPLQAQRNSSSPYSRYGYGQLHEPILGQSLAMGGTAIGLRSSRAVNPMNPATYSAIDSLSFLFDFAYTADIATFRENGVKEKASSYSLDHIVLKFPLAKNLGVSMGLYEYSQVGYSYNSSGNLPSMEGDAQEVSYVESYTATGGINNLYLGASYSLFNHLALGFNWNCKFGDISYSQSLTYPSHSAYSSMAVVNSMSLRQSSFEFGLQYFQNINRKNGFVLGVTYEMATPFKADVTTTSIVLDTLVVKKDDSFGTPEKFGIGLSYVFDDRFTLALDYEQQNWASAPFFSRTDTLSDTRRFAIGLEYLPSKYGEYYYQVVKYRLGFHYADSYVKVAGGNLKDVGLSFGLGMPLRNQRSSLNVSFEFGKTLTPASATLKENYARMSVGVLFNEVWFMKRRFN